MELESHSLDILSSLLGENVTPDLDCTTPHAQAFPRALSSVQFSSVHWCAHEVFEHLLTFNVFLFPEGNL